MKKLSLFSLFFLLILTACRKDVDEVTVVEDTPTPQVIEGWQPRIENINGSLRGQVIDENDAVVTDATIRLGNLSTTTDEYGYFSFSDVTMNSKGAYVTVEKSGYFPGSRRFFPQADAVSRVKIELIDQSFDQSFEAAAGATITFDGVAVEFPANAIRTASGEAYTGTVNIATHYLDPTNPSTYQQMPGNLQGVDAMSEEVALKTLGMIAVELEDPSGAPLNIVDGQKATITVPVPASLQGDAPSEIPLWSFNEEFGIWAQEGTATLQNGAYVGEVAHFSFWNCDIPAEYVDLSLTLVNANGDPHVAYWVKLISGNFGTGYGLTDDMGFVSGIIPANEALTLEVLGLCGEVLYTTQVGPFSADTDLGNITITPSQLNQTTITGTAVDCNGAVITNGFISISSNNYNVVEELDNGAFSVAFTSCAGNSDIEVILIDLDNLIQSDPTVVTEGQLNDLGTVTVCGNALDEYITVTVDGVTSIYIPTNVQVADSLDFTFIGSFGQSDSTSIGFGFQGVTIGDYSGTESFIEIISNFALGWEIFSTNQSVDFFEVTTFDNDYIEGNFNGVMSNNWNQPPTDVNVSCEFRVKR